MVLSRGLLLLPVALAVGGGRQASTVGGVQLGCLCAACAGISALLDGRYPPTNSLLNLQYPYPMTDCIWRHLHPVCTAACTAGVPRVPAVRLLRQPRGHVCEGGGSQGLRPPAVCGAHHVCGPPVCVGRVVGGGCYAAWVVRRRAGRKREAGRGRGSCPPAQLRFASARMQADAGGWL